MLLGLFLCSVLIALYIYKVEFFSVTAGFQFFARGFSKSHGWQPMAKGQEASELNFYHMVIKAPSLVKCLLAEAEPVLKRMQHIPDLYKAHGTSAMHTNNVPLVPRKARQSCHLLGVIYILVISVMSKLTLFTHNIVQYRADDKMGSLVFSY